MIQADVHTDTLPRVPTMGVTLRAHGYDTDLLRASVVRILGANTLCSMATRNEAGAVHISSAFFCFDYDLQLYYLSHPNSLHSRNLARVPEMAISVFDSHQGWGDLHVGLQLFGTATLAGEATRRAVGIYTARFPRSRALVFPAPGAPSSSAFRDLQCYRFVPDRVQILDESEFGEEMFIPAAIIR